MKSFLFGIIGACVIGALYMFVWKPNSMVDEDQELAGRIRTAEVLKTDIKFEINLAGEITPFDVVSVRPEVPGRISALPVDISDQVKAGDLLFALDDKDLLIEIESRETEIRSAKLQLEQARRLYQRQADLFDDQLVSTEEFENSKTNYELAKNRTEQAQKDLALTMDRLSRTKIKAPFDGTVLTRSVSLGQAVSGSSGFNNGTEVMTIADLNKMIINAHVNQVDVTRLKTGMNVSIEIEAVNGLRVGGVIDRIAPQATIKSRTKGYETRITLTEINDMVQPGMTANVVIPIAASTDVFAVPMSAVYTEYNAELKEMERYVYVQKGEKFVMTPVKIGINDYSFVEILDGLYGGEMVAIEQPDPEEILTEESSDQKPLSTSIPKSSSSNSASI